MNNGFALKLSLSNIKKNRKFYLPYLFASIGMITMFYIMSFLAFNKGLKETMADYQSLTIIMMLGCVVLGIFAVIFIFYINSFLMKRRKTEIGLYNILGMEKKHIGRILFIENSVLSVTALIAGIVTGIVFSKLVFMLLCKTMLVEAPITSNISVISVLITLAVFGGIFFLTLIKNQMDVVLAKPIEMLRGSKEGEKEPRSRLLIAIIGTIALVAGYYIAITTDNPLSAISLFFIAVLLVILGTYMIFIAGSITLLKALKKNKKFYYKPGHFTAVSGMIYRMKQNAVGLANICILSTMVLVMISTTVCLRIGIDDLINKTAPSALTVNYRITEFNQEKINQLSVDLKEACEKEDVEIKDLKEYTELTIINKQEGDEYNAYSNKKGTSQMSMFSIITMDQYEVLTGKSIRLANNQVLCAGTKTPEMFTVNGMTFAVKDYVDDFLPVKEASDGYLDTSYLVVANSDILNKVYEYQEKTGIEGGYNILHRALVDSDASDAVLNRVASDVQKEAGEFVSYTTSFTRGDTEKSFYGFTGSFLFLGIFLGIVFTFAAALIIYYKQISEGYYDKDKFEIMQKVGMSRSEVKKAIKSQVLMVFFAPLIMAGIHIIAAFNLIKQILILFSLSNVWLFVGCMAATFGIFAIIYGIVYLVTAREYYKIVRKDE